MRIKITLPLWIVIGKKKHALSLNNYRNAHFRTLVELKKQVERIVFEQLPKERIKHTKALIVVEFYPDNEKKDLDNFQCVAVKFCNDSIVNSGLLINDTVKNIGTIESYFVEVDKENPRIELKYFLTQ